MATLRIPLLAPTGIATIWSVMQVDFDTGDFRAMSDYHGGGTRVALFQARKESLGRFDWRFYRARGITTDQIERSFELLRALLERPQPKRVLLRAEMLFRAAASLAHRDWSGALVGAWTASEGLLGDLLDRYVEREKSREKGNDPAGNQHDFIETGRAKWLKGSDMTARHKMEFLSLANALPFELYLALRQCSSARNRWIHDEVEPSGEVANLAVSALGRLFELVEEVPLHVVWEDWDARA